MQSPLSPRPWPLLAVAALCASGCYAPMYQSPYGGYPAYPTTPGAPIQTLTPNGPYTPGTTIPQGSGTVSPGTPTYESGLTPVPDPGSGGTPYSPGTGDANSGNRPVPFYPDPSSADSSFEMPSQPQNTAGQSAPAGNASWDALKVPGGQSGEQNATAPAPVEESPTQKAEVPPEQRQPEAEVPGMSDRSRLQVPNPLPFAYDATNYRWLRGTVSYDQKDRSWSIVYSIDPEQDDPYAGALTLVGTPNLQGLKDGEVVTVQGQLDPVVRDRFGKSAYLVNQVVRDEASQVASGE
ncbi:MAG: hypothetical protein ACF8PG_10840 [Maioricimonas sp. JB045]|uniref:hypothetical protein n=1 Tax=Maioricimonas sp. JC845 TaxID=3232138 RepID=UPI00345921FD